MSNIKRVPTPFSYSAAVIVGDLVFLGLHRGWGNSFSAQLQDTFRHLEKTLSECGLTLNDLVKVNVWLKSIADLSEMEKLFSNYFPRDGFPARMTATTEFIDTDCLLMIDGIACKE